MYDNGPINGHGSGYAIDNAFKISDSFTLAGASTVTGANFGIFTSPGVHLTSVDWTISSGSLGAGTVFGTGTAAVSDSYLFSVTNYDISKDSISIPTLNLGGGGYFFTLTNGAMDSLGSNAFWDQNNGPSTAFAPGQPLSGSESFQILGPNANPVPEPSQLTSLVMGLVALGGLIVFARKRGNAAA